MSDGTLGCLYTLLYIWPYGQLESCSHCSWFSLQDPGCAGESGVSGVHSKAVPMGMSYCKWDPTVLFKQVLCVCLFSPKSHVGCSWVGCYVRQLRDNCACRVSCR
jgi:hypothetical protein